MSLYINRGQQFACGHVDSSGIKLKNWLVDICDFIAVGIQSVLAFKHMFNGCYVFMATRLAFIATTYLEIDDMLIGPAVWQRHRTSRSYEIA